MAKPSSRNKRLRRVESVDDRISELPDSILVIILSFLSTRLAVQTSVLSKRWISLWTSVPCLSFDDSHGTTCSSTCSRKTRFLRFVKKVLQVNNSPWIDELRVDTASICSQSKSEVGSWIRNAIKRKVRTIDLDLPCMWFNFPHTTFFCETLVVLKLSGGMSIRVPTSASLPNLKTMVLRLVRFFDSVSATNLITCCPDLENLSIWRVEWLDETKKFSIDARKLKCLEIDLFFQPQFIQLREYDINAPSLEYLDIKDYASKTLSITNVGCLKKADISVGKASACKSFVKCFEAFNNLQFLSLSYNPWRNSPKENMETGLEVLYLFNLTHLTMGGKSPWRSLLPFFLRCFPNLQVLRLVHEEDDTFARFDKSIPLELPPANLLSKLRVVEIEDFTEDELGMLKYIVENGKVLETVRIHKPALESPDSSSTTDNEEEEVQDFKKKFRKSEQKCKETERMLKMAQEILSFSRGSRTCKITYS